MKFSKPFQVICEKVGCLLFKSFIEYLRTKKLYDQDGPKLSDYSIARISKPDELLVTLGQALGIRGEVSVLKFGTIKRF